MPNRSKTDIVYPDGKDFIFTIFDDTDVATLGNIQPIYDFLSSVGIYTTKSVWPLNSDCRDSDYLGSHTLEHDAYRNYIVTLADKGFEIGFHGASMESSLRERTRQGLDYFKNVVGYYPSSYACHAGNKENMYWGQSRFKHHIFKKLYKILNKDKTEYQGEKEASPFFWGDICYEKIDYIRTFTFSDINLLKIRSLPLYINKDQKYSRYCFITSDADNVNEFNKILCRTNQERLERERGVCILTTHFGKGFVKRGKLNPVTQDLLTQLSRRNGWFAPVSKVLEYLKGFRGETSVQNDNLFSLELKWFVHAFKRQLNRLPYEKTELEYLFPKDLK